MEGGFHLLNGNLVSVRFSQQKVFHEEQKTIQIGFIFVIVAMVTTSKGPSGADSSHGGWKCEGAERLSQTPGLFFFCSLIEKFMAPSFLFVSLEADCKHVTDGFPETTL